MRCFLLHKRMGNNPNLTKLIFENETLLVSRLIFYLNLINNI